MLSQQIKFGVNGHALLTELSRTWADTQHMAKYPVVLTVICLTHTCMHTCIHRLTPPLPNSTYLFWIRTPEDMNHCVIGLGSSSGQNMHDSSSSVKRLFSDCDVRAGQLPLHPQPTPPRKKPGFVGLYVQYFTINN